jgi:hypothetical protein
MRFGVSDGRRSKNLGYQPKTPTSDRQSIVARHIQ